MARPARTVLPLTEREKIEILFMRREQKGICEIARQMDRNESTIRSFLKMYELRGELFPKRGRPQTVISQEIQGVLIDELNGQPRLSIRDQLGQHLHQGISRSRVWEIRHKNHYHFYQETPVCPLDQGHKDARVRFCETILTQIAPDVPIIFTDESTVQVNLCGRGIWRKHGVHIPESFIPKVAHPVQVMIWGGIGPGGFRTELIQCPKSVNGQSYIEFLANIIPTLNQVFPQGYLFQQDNASPHLKYKDLLANWMHLLEWPARSPDLSPIEQIWAHLKVQLRQKSFTNQKDLFEALQREWNQMSPDMVDNFYSSFRARCAICRKYGGASLNRHWNEVHDEGQHL
jgi:transposase-like protein